MSISQNHTKSSHFLYYQPVSCTKYITFTSFKQKDDIVTSCWISILVLDAPDDEKDKITVIWFSPELTWLYCAPLWALYIEEDKNKTKKNWKTYLIVLWTTLSTIQKRKAKKMQMIGRPHSSLAGSCAAGCKTYLILINYLIILYQRYDLNDPGPYLMSKSCRPKLSVGFFWKARLLQPMIPEDGRLQAILRNGAFSH